MSAGGDDGPAVFDSAELLVRLADVDAELPGDEHIEIAVIGGAAITFLRAGRVTNDVDVISEGMPQTLRDAAARVASRHALRTDWINNAAKIGLPRLEPQLETIYRGERLTVHRAGPKYLLATKLNAGRPIYIEDAVHLAITPAPRRRSPTAPRCHPARLRCRQHGPWRVAEAGDASSAGDAAQRGLEVSAHGGDRSCRRHVAETVAGDSRVPDSSRSDVDAAGLDGGGGGRLDAAADVVGGDGPGEVGVIGDGVGSVAQIHDLGHVESVTAISPRRGGPARRRARWGPTHTVARRLAN